MNKEKGFSLVELLVAITLFTLVVGSITGLSVAAIRSQAKALALQKLLDETSYVMEYMSRALRMAKKDLGPTCLSARGLNYENPGGDLSRIRFINYDGKCQEFLKEGTQLKEKKSTDNTATNLQPPLELTSTKLEVFSLQFNLSGQSQSDVPNLQPRVTIVLKIKKAGAAKPEIQIQTTISQRNLDVQE